MLKRLYISNFALINEMDVTFPGKLTVITGETGAGKSIFLEALGLALGKRADLSVVQNKSKKCVIEAEFDITGLDMKAVFEANDLDFDKHLVLRREISADGKSRSFLNDSVVGLNALKALSEQLIDIHSQHQVLLLGQANFQLEMLDAFAGTLALYNDYKIEYNTLTRLKTSLKDLMEKEAQARKELDYFQFLFTELEDSEIKPGMLQLLEEESMTLENAGTIKNNLANAANLINGGETNLLSQLSYVRNALQANSKFGKEYVALFERVNTLYIEMKDLGSELEDADESVNVDERRLEEVNGKLDKVNRLLKKHNVNDEAGLLKIKEEIEGKLLQFSTLESEIQATNRQIETLTVGCVKLADKLSALRSKATPAVEKKVKEMLSGLSMQNAAFKIDLKRLAEPGTTGFDQVTYLFSANKGGDLNELQKVASGGELSRLMLSLKALLAEKKQLPTIIFDEIDTGVSGDVADKIGNILYNMGKTMQVVTITHLPQMASKGDHHLFVYKKDDADKTVSYIRQLNKDERVTEIAKMLSTGQPTQSALVNAKELLNLN